MDVGCPKLSFPPNLLLEVSCSGSGVPLPLEVGYPLWQSVQAERRRCCGPGLPAEGLRGARREEERFRHFPRAWLQQIYFELKAFENRLFSGIPLSKSRASLCLVHGLGLTENGGTREQQTCILACASHNKGAHRD